MAAQPRQVLVTGSTGYIGQRLIPVLLARGHAVRALARAGSRSRVHAGAEAVVGDALDPASVSAAARAGDTLVHLVGTPHPSPAKAAEFRRVDLPSVAASVAAARHAGAAHVVYVSVAQPAPAMKAFLAVRAEGEAIIRGAGLTATFVRPWYVLGPGHRWPLLLVPFYALARAAPRTREGAIRLGLVTIEQMISALVLAIEQPPPAGTIRIVDVPAIAASRLEVPVASRA
jgi:uncharacterized protein YbjT (DUF2867 family)